MKRGCSRTDIQIDEKSLDALEYLAIIDLLARNACSPVGKERCRQVRPQADLTAITRSLSQIDEFKRIDNEWGPVPAIDVQDTRDALSKVRVPGAVLEPQSLIHIAANTQTSEKIKRFFTEIDAGAPSLMSLINGLTVCRELGAEILRCLDPDGMIRDGASPRLMKLRESIRELRTRIHKEMERLLNDEDFQPVLQDRIITQRNGRAVLLLKPEFRRRVKGIVHDHSQSRMSLFVEPMSVVEMNNDLSLLLDDEREEEIRVLQGLTESVQGRHDDLWQDLELLAELDMVSAKTELSRLFQAIQPEIIETRAIRLLKARHPLLFQRKRDETVPIDLFLEPDHPVLVISGANAGGKTVALKTLGLLALMFQSGLEIPCGEGSRIPVYQKIFAEIGDEQSIGDDLSTFSAHLVHIQRILEEADTRSLVLVDEIGGGTNVMEGAALAMGILDCLKEKGANVVVTTHLEPLKGYGYVAKGVTNAGVEFDPETLQPRYRLSYGTSAPSHAFLVAERMGVSNDTLEKARQYQQETEGAAGALIQRLEELQAEVSQEKEQLLRLQDEATQRRDRLDEALKRIRQKKDQILLRVEERGRRLLSQAEKDVKRLAQSLRTAGPGEKKPERKLREIENHLRSQVKGQRRRGTRIENLKTGEWVRIVDLNREGVVSQVQETIDMAEVLVGQFKIKTSLVNLERVTDRRTASEKTATSFPTVSSSGDALREINVIGLTADEALPVVDKFIDSALLENLETVTIIHGAGSGRLRKAIRDYLEEHRAVKGLGDGDPVRGGFGVTVVQLGWETNAAVATQQDDHSPLR